MQKSLIPILVLVAGCAISFWIYSGLTRMETERAAAEFDRRAANVSTVLTNGIKGYSTAMKTLKNLTSVGLRNSSETVPAVPENYEELRQEWILSKVYFHQMARDAGVSFPGLIGLGWVVQTPYEGLNGIEMAGKFLISPDYEIRGFGDDGQLAEPTASDEHFPIFYIEPMEDNKIALGIDLASAGMSRRAIVEARDTGRTVSTPPISWIKQQTGQLGFLVFDAIYLDNEPMDTLEAHRENLHSVSFGVILVDDMLNSSLRGIREEGLDYFVFAHSEDIEEESPSAVPIFSSNGKPESWQEIRNTVRPSGFEQRLVFDVLGRDWSLYAYSKFGFLSKYQSRIPVIAFATGVLLSLGLALYLFQSAGRRRHIEAMVNQRTLELSRSNQLLQMEIANRIAIDRHSKELESRLLQTQKMDMVGQLAGGVAHDFNNLLQAILGYGEIAMEGLDEDSAVYGNVDQIMLAGERARVLVRQLLAFSRRQELSLSDLNLEAVMTELTQMIQRLIGQHITLDFIPGDQVGMIRADRGQIEQVLINLCVNARDAMVDGGTLTIETRNVGLDALFCEKYLWASPGRYVLLCVSDTGCGISPEVREHIFEPFFTTKDQEKGTGLGLSTVFGILRQHGGGIDFRSEEGSGSTFDIYIPVVGGVESQAHVTDEFSEGGKETILLGDDEEIVLKVIGTVLRRAGYTVLEAPGGEEAIRLFDAHADEIDLALLDVVMPKVSGTAVAEHILATHPNFPILFCSGYRRGSIHSDLVSDDGMNLIQKPFSRSELLRRLREIIETETSRN